MSPGYYSSNEKDAIRQYFDLPLLTSLHRRKNTALSYFGLPGEDMLDIESWKPLINSVHAVEYKPDILEKMERTFIMQYPSIRAECHLGDVDKVILSNRGKERIIGGQKKRPFVQGLWCQGTGDWAWDFDIVNLDYFGPFLPADYGRIVGRIKNRADALRKLFELDRQDSWKRWILMITVEAELVKDRDIQTLSEYLNSLQSDSSREVGSILDFLTTPPPSRNEHVVRLIHGASAMLIFSAATNAQLQIHARGTILYKGAYGRPMIHLVYEFEPSGQPFNPATSRSSILCTPLLKLRDPLLEPWFELLTGQAPGLSDIRISDCLDFLDSNWIREITGSLHT